MSKVGDIRTNLENPPRIGQRKGKGKKTEQKGRDQKRTNKRERIRERKGNRKDKGKENGREQGKEKKRKRKGTRKGKGTQGAHTPLKGAFELRPQGPQKSFDICLQARKSKSQPRIMFNAYVVQGSKMLSRTFTSSGSSGDIS
jgi:hypothetical protein